MRHLLLLAVLALGATWTMAQNSQTQSPTSGQTAQTQSQPSTNDQTGTHGDMSPTSAGADKSVEGCLSGSDGNYTLTDKSGTSYQLTGDTSKLAEHVGHEVKITGSMASSSASSGGMAGETAGGKNTLQVSSVKHISKTCSSGGGMSH